MPNVQSDGFAILPRALPEFVVSELLAQVEPFREPGRGGARGLLDIEVVRRLASASVVWEVAEAVLGPHCFAVRALLFDKTPDANWRVAWHQDLAIAVAERVEVPGFGPWSVKAGVTHTHAPVAILEQMIAVRVHLDPCGPANGPVRVLPATHLCGKLASSQIESLRVSDAAVECQVPLGGLLVMRPLLLHASSPATEPGHRRVLHIEFAACELPVPLRWQARCSPELFVGAT